MATLKQLDPDVFTIEGLFTPEECCELISRAESIGFEPASVRTRSGPQMMPNIRNNDRVVLVDQELAEELWRRVAPLLPTLDDTVATGVDSTLRFYRYVPGQKFNRHRDGSATNELGETSKLSYLIYLNSCDGGATLFRDYVEIDGRREKKELRIEPAPGTALLFRHKRWHEGLPVASGEKYVLRTDVFYAQATTE